MNETIYLSGPMSNHPNLNFPAFTQAAEQLRKQGYHVISPHEVGQTDTTWDSCMRQDIKALMDCHKVAVLEGWQMSKGARIEVNLARDLGMPIIDAYTLEDVV